MDRKYKLHLNMNLNFREMMMKSKHRGLGVKELLKWRAIQQKEKIQIGGDFNFTDPEPDYEESKAETDSTIGYVKGPVSHHVACLSPNDILEWRKFTYRSYDQQVIAKVCNNLTFVARLVNTDLILIMSLLYVGGKRRNTFCRRTLLRKKSSFLRNTHISLLESACLGILSFMIVVLPHQIRARHSVFLHFILYGQQPNHRQYKHHHHWEAAFSKIFPFFQLQGNIQENVPKYVK
ncbi:hypothetical protein HN51_021124, partial [Arachis hypogaea]